MSKFEIINVPEDAPQAIEQMGTKHKFWFHHEQLGRCLFKKARENTGEDWAEKVASELCELLGLPHARYELSVWGNNYGVVSPYFLPENGSLIHGNEILRKFIPDYPEGSTSRKNFYKISQYTLSVVLNIIKSKELEVPYNWKKPDGIDTALQTFIGYLIFDAWVGNTDRHHENWALILQTNPRVENKLYLAPTFDHASSLGRELTDEERKTRLNTKDIGYSVQAYVNKCVSAFYSKEEDKKPLTTFEAFYQAAQQEQEAAKIWINRVEKLSKKDIESILMLIPQKRISQVATDFALRMLEINRIRLLELKEKLK